MTLVVAIVEVTGRWELEGPGQHSTYLACLHADEHAVHQQVQEMFQKTHFVRI